MSNFFSEALRQAMRDRHFNQAQLADFLSVDPAYISRWLKGSSPRLDQLTGVLRVLGWDLNRARPDYDAFSDAIQSIDGEEKDSVKEAKSSYKNLEEIKSLLSDVAETRKSLDVESIGLSGTVKGDSGAVQFRDSKGKHVNSAQDLFDELDYAENELFYLDVTSDSTDPLIQKGTKLFFRRVLRHQSVPSGAAVILEPVSDPSNLQIRRLIRLFDETSGRVDRLVGAPVSKNQDYIYFKPRDMKLAAILVGVLSYPPTEALN